MKIEANVNSKRQITLKQILGGILILGLFLALFAPYATQLSPPIALQLVDENSVGIPNVTLNWRGGFYAYNFEEELQTDKNGKVAVPMRSVALSPLARFKAILSCLLPHSGWNTPSAGIYFGIPKGYTFDATCIGATKANQVGEWKLSNDWWLSFTSYENPLPDVISIWTDRPTSVDLYSQQLRLNQRK